VEKWAGRTPTKLPLEMTVRQAKASGDITGVDLCLVWCVWLQTRSGIQQSRVYDSSVDCSETSHVPGNWKINHYFPRLLFYGPVKSFLSRKGLFDKGVLHSSLGG